jgi:glucose-1-phosphate thymidylyltransferase
VAEIRPEILGTLSFGGVTGHSPRTAFRGPEVEERRIYERCSARWRNGKPAESSDASNEQAPASHLQQADGYYPIQTLVNTGIEEILLVTGGKNAEEFLRLLGNGRDFGLKHINYTYQEGEGGIAQALGLAEYFAGDESICVVLGDNIIENNICQAVKNFVKQGDGAKILLKEVSDVQRFGVAEIRGSHVMGIEEKPKSPKSNFAVIGIYLYDKTVFQKIRRLNPSGRGELEITDVNNFYIEEDKLTYEILDGWWTDAGTFESLLRANNLVAETGANKMDNVDESQLAGQKSVGL